MEGVKPFTVWRRRGQRVSTECKRKEERTSLDSFMPSFQKVK